MRTIDLSDSIYQRLLQRAVSFEDRPEDVIVRLLDQVEEGDRHPRIQADKPAGRAAPGSVLPVEGYWLPILQILAEAGGAAPSNDVVNALEERMSDALTERDYEPLQSGEIRWRNRARFARLRMKERGLLSDASRRGVWQITPAGEDYLLHREREVESE